jgi:hypothetical protein
MAFSYRGEHAGEDLEAEVFLVSKAVCSELDEPDIRVSENALEHRLRHMAGERIGILKSLDWSHTNCIPLSTIPEKPFSPLSSAG